MCTCRKSVTFRPDLWETITCFSAVGPGPDGNEYVPGFGFLAILLEETSPSKLCFLTGKGSLHPGEEDSIRDQCMGHNFFPRSANSYACVQRQQVARLLRVPAFGGRGGTYFRHKGNVEEIWLDNNEQA